VITVRQATADDWSSIWPIFSAVVTAGDSYAYPEDLTSDQARDLWIEPAPGQTVVALVCDRIVGSAKMGPNRGGRGAHIATASFMVDPEARSHGTGRTLGRYVIDWATEHGYRGIQFNAVVETNTPAVSLWQDLGFQIIGTVPGAFEHPTQGYVGLHLMYLDLTPHPRE
jgi:GNAT superfamily N-acetyltransferase